MSAKKKFLCTQCPQTFTRASNLQRHVACVHEDVRRFACTMCDKSFKRKRDLDGHMFAAHLQITPFVCEHPGCDRAFARQEQLRIHRKAHEYAASVGDSPFVSPAVLAASAVAAAAGHSNVGNNINNPVGAIAAAAAIASADMLDGVPPPPPPPARRRKRAKRSDDNDDSDDEYRDGYHATATNYRYAPPKQQQVSHPHPLQQQPPPPSQHHLNHLHPPQPHLLHSQLPNLLAPLHHMQSLSNSHHLVATPAAALANGSSFPHINDSLLNLAFTHSNHHQSASSSSHNLSAILSPRSANDEPDFKRPMLAHHEQLSRGLFAIPGAPVPHSARASLAAAIGQADAANAAATAASANAGATNTNGAASNSAAAATSGAAGNGAAAANGGAPPSKPSGGGAPTVLTAFLDAAHQNFLVKHENHVDALIDGRLLSLNHRFEEHDISTVIEFCDDARMQHTDNDCDHDHHGHDHHGKGGHSEKKTEVLSPLEAHHQHAIGCGHIAVQHGDHTDFLVGHHLHHPAAGEDGHCVNHGHINMLSIDALYADGGLDATSWRELFAAESLFSASTATN